MQNPLNPKVADEHAVKWIFVVDTLNFCFWFRNQESKFVVEYQGKEYSGLSFLFFSFLSFSFLFFSFLFFLFLFFSFLFFFSFFSFPHPSLKDIGLFALR